jgi:hypothetical protein
MQRFVAAIVLALLVASAPTFADHKPLSTGAFVITNSVVLPGTAEEIFDEDGNGVLHATVTAADRGKLLRFVGPLGLAGNAIDMVHTYEFAAIDDGRTSLTVTVRAHGELQEAWAEAVDGVWNHFLVERLKPCVESGKHLEKQKR